MSIDATLVGWCEDCGAYVEPYAQGESCPGYRYYDADGCQTKRLRKRRMFICRDSRCDGVAFFARAGYMNHLAVEHAEVAA